MTEGSIHQDDKPKGKPKSVHILKKKKRASKYIKNGQTHPKIYMESQVTPNKQNNLQTENKIRRLKIPISKLTTKLQ